MDDEYAAFISYRAGLEPDRSYARRFHHAVERFALPSALRKDGSPKHIGRIFRDAAELRATGNLAAEVKERLTRARHLIVICTPNAKASEWMNDEIRWFREVRPDGHILPILLLGDFADSAPTELVRPGEDEPLWLDVRPGPERRRREAEARLRVIARLSDVEYDALRRRHATAQLRRAWALVAVTTALAVAFAALALFAFLQRQDAVDSRNEAVVARGKEAASRERAEVSERRAVTMRLEAEAAKREAERARSLAEQRRFEAEEARRAEVLQRELADGRRREAESRGRDIQARSLAGDARRSVGEDPGRAVRFAWAAVHTHPGPEAWSALYETGFYAHGYRRVDLELPSYLGRDVELRAAGGALYVAAQGGRAVYRLVAPQTRTQLIRTDAAAPVSGLAIDARLERLAVLWNGGLQASIHDLVSGAELSRFRLPSGTNLQWSASSGSLLLSGAMTGHSGLVVLSRDGGLRLVRMESRLLDAAAAHLPHDSRADLRALAHSSGGVLYQGAVLSPNGQCVLAWTDAALHFLRVDAPDAVVELEGRAPASFIPDAPCSAAYVRQRDDGFQVVEHSLQSEEEADVALVLMSEPRGLGFSPDATLVVISTHDGVSILDWDSGRALENLRSDRGAQQVIRWSPTSECVLLPVRSVLVRWCRQDDLHVHTNFPGSAHHAMQWSPDGRRYVVPYGTGAEFWQARGRDPSAILSRPSRAEAAVWLSPDEVVVSDSGGLSWWRPEVNIMPSLGGESTFSSDGRYAALSSPAIIGAQVSDFATGAGYDWHEPALTEVLAWRPLANELLVCAIANDGEAEVLQLRDPLGGVLKQAAPDPPDEGAYGAIAAWSRDGQLLVFTRRSAQSVFFWRPTQDDEESVHVGVPIADILLSPTSSEVAVVAEAGDETYVISTTSAADRWTLAGTAVGWLVSGLLVLSADRQHLEIWRNRTQLARMELQDGCEAERVFPIANGRYAVAQAREALCTFDSRLRRRVRARVSESARIVAERGGRLIVADDREVYMLDVQTREVRALPLPLPIQDAVWHPEDSNRLALIVGENQSGHAIVWNVLDGLVARLPYSFSEEAPQRVVYSADGRSLYVSGSSGTISFPSNEDALLDANRDFGMNESISPSTQY